MRDDPRLGPYSTHMIFRNFDKPIVTSATLVVTGALLVVTKKLLELNLK